MIANEKKRNNGWDTRRKMLIAREKLSISGQLKPIVSKLKLRLNFPIEDKYLLTFWSAGTLTEKDCRILRDVFNLALESLKEEGQQ